MVNKINFSWSSVDARFKAYLLYECVATHDILKNEHQICNVCKLGKSHQLKSSANAIKFSYSLMTLIFSYGFA